MAGLLDGMLALVTGAGSGIGAGIARAMAEAGARVIVADVNAAGAQQVAGEIGAAARAVTLDVTDRAAVDALAQDIRGRDGPISAAASSVTRRRAPTGTRPWRSISTVPTW